MRADRPIPGNLWPHDMVIRINDDVESLLELLWVREAWALEPAGEDLPPAPEALPEIPPSAQRLRRHKHEWERAWTELWSAALDHHGRRDDDALIERLQATPPGSPERHRLLADLQGPSWRDRFGDEPFGEAYQDWIETLSRRDDEHRLPIEEHPERRCLDALVPAWERGLTQLFTIPCAGDWSRTVGPHAMVLTVRSRTDPDSYRRALRSFGR